jgi:hypothetical protein
MEAGMSGLTSDVDLHEIPFGGIKGAIYRRADIVDSSWFFRMHLKQEKRYWRVSLTTKDRAEAFEKAQSVMVRVLAKAETGQSVMAVSN